MESLSSSLCRSCRLRLNKLPSSRSFSTTKSRQIVPPESPAFVDVPESYQAEVLSAPRRKGVLPVPRELFPAKRPDKPSQQYLNNVTKDLQSHNVRPEAELTDMAKFRLRASETRKRHLREGLTELYARKQQTTAKLTYRSQRKQAERARLITQPEREDSRLTSVSTPTIMRSSKSSTPIADDLNAIKAIYETKKANHERHTQAKKEERLDALHTLYMNARSFITTEAQLSAAIEEQFDTDIFATDINSSGKSMWSHGAPDTIRDMIANTRGGEKAAGQTLAVVARGVNPAVRARYMRDQERMQKIAEKLSGGKM